MTNEGDQAVAHEDDEMKHGFRLMFQKDLNEKEKEAALKAFHWFIRSSFNPQKWDEEKKKFMPIDNVQLPSWKHIARGGHPNGLPLQRGKWGLRLDFFPGIDDIGKSLLFRRFGKKERLFVVQRTDSVDVKPEGVDGCLCNRHLGGRPGRSRILLEDFEQYAVIGESKG